MKTLCKGCCCLIAAVAAFGADAGLPPGWRELQYVTADGTQYLDTGFRLTADEWDYILDGAIVKDSGYSGVNNYLEFQANTCGADGKRHVFHFAVNSDFKCTYSVDGGAAKAKNGTRGSGSVIGFLVMGQGDGFMSTDPLYVQKGDVYSFVLKKNGGVVQHLVPAKDPDGVACFYDIQQGKPFYSAGSSAFVAGPLALEYEIAPIPRQVQATLGEDVEPELFVTNKTTRARLVLGEDYAVSFENNKAAGTATAHVTGMNAYEGQNTSVDFEIVVSYAAYRHLEYVTGTGAQYVNTETCLDDRSWVYDLDATIVANGKYTGSNNGLCIQANNTFGVDGKRHDFTIVRTDGTQTVYVDGILKKKDTGRVGNLIGVFAMGGSTTKFDWTGMEGDIYSFRLVRDEVTLMDLAPVKDENGIACFYDKVQMKLVYSAGADDFVAGPPPLEYEIAPVPRQVLVDFDAGVEPELFVTNTATRARLVLGEDYEVSYENNKAAGTATAHVTGMNAYEGQNASVDFEIVVSYAAYTHLEYVTGTGTQCINTGILLSNKTWTYELDAAIEANDAYCGNDNSLYFEAKSKFGFDGARHKVKAIGTGGKISVYLDDQLKTSFTGGTRGIGALIAVFAMGNSASTIGYLGMRGDIYSFRLYEEGTLVMDLEPVLDADGIACFYDKVQMKSFYSAGSDPFAAGPVRSELEIDPIPVQRVVGGGVATPEPTVRSLGTGQVLKLNEDYEIVGYANNDKPGIATVRISGKGAYAGSLENTAEFAIAAVFCVTPEAKSTGTGLTWADATPFSNAVAAVSAVADVPCEIWVAGEVDVPLAPEVQTWGAPSVSVLGGFAGTERSPEERSPVAVSVLDGKDRPERILGFSNAKRVDLERLTFRSAKFRALVKTGGEGDLTVRDCQFVANGLTSNAGGSTDMGRASYVKGGGSKTAECVFSNCVFSGNCITAGNGAGCAIYGETLHLMTIADCLFVTNGVLTTGGIGTSIPGNSSKGSCIQLQDSPVHMRNCHFRGNRGKVTNSSGGIVYFYQSCGGSEIENCSFAGTSDDCGADDVSSVTGVCGGAIVVQMRSSGDTISIRNSTIAYNLADAPLAPGGIDVVCGIVNIDNSVVCANRRGKFGQVGADISVRDNGRVNLSYCHLTEGDPATGRPTAACVSETGEGLVTFDHLTFGDPKLKTRFAVFEGCIRTEGDYTYLDNSQSGVNRRCGFDLHERRSSPLVDAGDPASDYSKEPLPNGGRVNLGAYGNTVEAAITRNSGLILMLK